MASMTLDLGSVYPPLPTLDDKKAELIPKIDQYTSLKILDGFEHTLTYINGANGQAEEDTYFFKYDTDDQQNFSDMSSAALLVLQKAKMTPEEIAANPAMSSVVGMNDILTGWRGWKGEVAYTLLLTASQFINLGTAAGAHKANTLAHGWLMKDSVLSASTEEELKGFKKTYTLDEKFQWVEEVLRG